MSDPRHIARLFDALAPIRERVGVSEHARAESLLRAAGYLSASELAYALQCSETHADAILRTYYREHPDAWHAELQRRRRILEPF